MELQQHQMLSVYLNPSGLLKLNLLLLSLASSFFHWKTVGIRIYFTVGSNQSKAIAMQVLTLLIKMHNWDNWGSGGGRSDETAVGGSGSAHLTLKGLPQSWNTFRGWWTESKPCLLGSGCRKGEGGGPGGNTAVFQYLKGCLLGEEADLYHTAPRGKLHGEQTSDDIKETFLTIRAVPRQNRTPIKASQGCSSTSFVTIWQGSCRQKIYTSHKWLDLDHLQPKGSMILVIKIQLWHVGQVTILLHVITSEPDTSPK